MLKLFTKYGIDCKAYALTRTALLKALDKDYELNKKSDNDKAAIFKSAVSKLTPPDFADCLNEWALGSILCDTLFYGDDNGMLICFSLVMASYLACIASLP
ncbi:MAG: hypothetical protein JWP69_2127 [Flaviaesturariibacter sp.]|nr:hypothetical protein [Flaviaesturariibacter sp.]